MRKVITNLAVALLLTASFVLVGKPITAHANFNPSCPYGDFCAYDGLNGSGTRWVFTFSGSGGVGHCNQLTSSTGNQQWTSLLNGLAPGGYGDGHTLIVQVYNNYYCYGAVNAFFHVPVNLTDYSWQDGTTMNNSIHSFVIEVW